MTIDLYRNYSDSNVVNKRISILRSYTGTLKDACELLNPVIVMTGVDIVLADVNYAYIPSFNRYYHVVNIRNIRNDVWEISLKVDVLYSYRNQFLPLSAVIGRQENLYSLYLNDDKFRVEQKPLIIQKKFPNKFTSQSYVLLVAGGN